MTVADYGLLSPAWAGTTVASATDDPSFLQSMLDVEAAWVAVLADAGLCPQEDADALDAAADAALHDLPSLAARNRDGGNPLIPLLGDLRRQLRQNDAGASAAASVHRGATSQDIVDTALMLTAARAGAQIGYDLRRAADGLAHLAREHAETVCVARSLTQHGLPTTFGLRAANWLSGVVLAGRRLDAALAALPLQWGGAVGTLASLTDQLAVRASDGAPAAGDGSAGSSAAAGPTVPELTAALADRLGLVDPGAPWHTNRLPVTGLGAALADVAAAAGKVAADVLTFSRPEIAEVAEPREEGKGGSSAMPQKQNPVLSVLIRNAALSAPQHAAQLFLAAGTAVDERPDGSWHTEWAALRELLRLAGGAAEKLADLANGLTVNRENMARNAALSGGLLVSERIMARLSGRIDGGKEALQGLVRESLASGRPLRALLRDAIPAGRLDDGALAEVLDPSGYLGQAPAFIERITEDHLSWSNPHRKES